MPINNILLRVVKNDQLISGAKRHNQMPNIMHSNGEKLIIKFYQFIIFYY